MLDTRNPRVRACSVGSLLVLFAVSTHLISGSVGEDEFGKGFSVTVVTPRHGQCFCAPEVEVTFTFGFGEGWAGSEPGAKLVMTLNDTVVVQESVQVLANSLEGRMHAQSTARAAIRLQEYGEFALHFKYCVPVVLLDGTERLTCRELLKPLALWQNVDNCWNPHGNETHGIPSLTCSIAGDATEECAYNPKVSDRFCRPTDLSTFNAGPPQFGPGSQTVGVKSEGVDYSELPPLCSYVSLSCKTGWHNYGTLAAPMSWADRIFVDYVWMNHPNYRHITELGTYFGTTSLFLGMLSRVRGGQLHTFDIKDFRLQEARFGWLDNMHYHVVDVLSSVHPVVVESVSREGGHMAFFDNGDKKVEFAMYCQFFKLNDLLLVHDWGQEIVRDQISDAAERCGFKEIAASFARRIGTHTRAFKRLDLGSYTAVSTLP